MVNSGSDIGSDIAVQKVENVVNSASIKTLQGVDSVDNIQRSLRNVKRPDYNDRNSNDICLSVEEGDPRYCASDVSEDG